MVAPYSLPLNYDVLVVKLTYIITNNNIILNIKYIIIFLNN